MTKGDVCSLTLVFLGQMPITAFTEQSDWATKFRAIYPTVALDVLKLHAWSDAVRYVTYVSEYTESYTSHDTLNISGASTLEATTSIDTQTPNKGTVTIDSTEYEYTSYTGAIFTLAGTLSATYDNADTITVTPNNRINEYKYMYALPSACIKALDIEMDSEVDRYIENGFMYTNRYDATNGIRLRYIADITEEVLSGEVSAVVYNETIANVIAMKMAIMMAPSINPQMVGAALGAYTEALNTAVGTEATERHPTDEELEWVDIK